MYNADKFMLFGRKFATRGAYKCSNYLEHLFGIVTYALFINPNDEEMKHDKDDITYILKMERFHEMKR